MGREDKAKQVAKGRGRSVLPTKNASIMGEEGRMRRLCRVATFIVVGISLFAGVAPRVPPPAQAIPRAVPQDEAPWEDSPASAWAGPAEQGAEARPQGWARAHPNDQYLCRKEGSVLGFHHNRK